LLHFIIHIICVDVYTEFANLLTVSSAMTGGQLVTRMSCGLFQAEAKVAASRLARTEARNARARELEKQRVEVGYHRCLYIRHLFVIIVSISNPFNQPCRSM